MPRLLSNRKPVARPEDLKENRWEYLNLQQAQPSLGLAPQNETGYTLQTDENGKVTYTNTLGKLQFNEQVISPTQSGVDIEISGLSQNSNIILTPYQQVQIDGNLEVSQDATIAGDFTVEGNPLGTFPINPSTLYVTPNGDDRNDGTALDASRACRTISGAVRSPFYTEGTTIKVAAGTYFEDNPIPLKPYTSVVGNDLRTTFVEPLNKDLDLFHVNSGVYIAQMQMRNLRRGSVERYAPGGAGTYTTGAYCCAFPPSLENPIDLYYSPYIQNCTNQTGPWLKDGTMFVPNQTVQIPVAAGTSTWVADANQITITLHTGTIAVGMAVNDAANEGYRNAQLLLKRNKEFLQRQVVGFVETTYPTLEYNQASCYRDVGFIVDAVSGDARFGGNKRSIEAGLAYWSGATSLIIGEQNQTAAAINYLRDISLQIILNETVTNLFDTTVDQYINENLDKGQVVTTRVSESYNLIRTILQNGEASVPATKEDLLGLIYPTGLSPNAVNVASTITAITTVSDNVYIITLSTSTVSPSDNATVYFGSTSVYPFLDADIPESWQAADADGLYADRRLDPFGAGGGALVDGNAPSLRSPIQSFVFDAFTQVAQGGRGIHIINNGYAQLVSVFTLFCYEAVTVENGGIASITNSNANFGDQCLTAKGLGKLAFGGFVRNDPFPTNRPNGEYYPLGYWPQRQTMEVFIPSDRDRPHIGQVMEVVAPDTYLDFSGNRVPYVNEVGYSGYLVATSNTGSITTGSYTINAIDVSNVAVGHTLYIRDIYGDEVSPVTGTPYVTTGTKVVDVNYQSVTLDRPILTGYEDLNNTNFFNLYFCGNAYYTVLSSTVDDTLSSTITNQTTLVPGQETTTSLAISFAKNLALRVIQNVPATGFVYNRVKCARDTGIIVDSIVSDLLFSDNGYTQSNFAGLQYWNQSGYTGSIAEELTTTTNAINFVSSLAQEIVQHSTTGTRYTTTATQSVVPPVATATEAEFIANDFGIITNILTNGTEGVTDIVVANGTSIVSANAEKAYNLLQANKQYIQEQAVAFVEDTKTVGFEYDMSLCYRDVGYMVDSIAFDLLYGGNRQAIQSGVYYYGFSGTSSAIPGETVQTIAAYNRLSEILSAIVTNTVVKPSPNNTEVQVTNLTTSTQIVGSTISNMVSLITNIIKNGPNAAETKTPISQTITADSDKINAAEILLANRDFISQEITSYVDKVYGVGFVYDQAKCKRDTELVVDSIALDVLYPSAGLSQSNFAGLQYWNQSNTEEIIPGELTTTTNAIRYVKELAREVVQGITTGTRYQSTVTQNTASLFATVVEADIVAEDFDLIVDILVDGIAGVTDRIITNGLTSTNTNLVNAYTLLVNNKSYIQREALAFIESTKFSYDESKCYRDSGLIVDSIALDLLYPSDEKSQSTFSGLQYWNQSGYTGRIDLELTTTTNAITYVKELAQKLVTNDTSGTRYQTDVPQVTLLPAASATEAGLVGDDFDVILDILTGGTVGVSDIIVSNSVEASTSTNIVRAYNILQANKAYLEAEAIAFVEDQKSEGFVYSQTKCARDVGYMVDSVSFDLLHGGNRQAIQSGVYYYNFDENSTAIPNEITQTISAFNFISELSQKVILNQPGTTYQSTVTQVISSTSATQFEAHILAENIATIVDIITNGPSVAATKTPIPLTPSYDINNLNAAKALEANREYIQAEVVAYVNQTQVFEFDRSLCYRDVGYMIDSVAFDLLHPNGDLPSNKQAIQSGVYYFGYNATSSAIAGEIPQTTAAYNFIKSLIPYVVQGIEVPTTYQTFVSQVTGLTTASFAIVADLETNIDHIVDIISNGPTAANAKTPIALAQNSDPDALNAYNLLIANKDFIKEEVVAYINDLYPSGTYQTTISQVFDQTLTGGEDAVNSLADKFDIIANIVKNGADSSPSIQRPRQYVDANQNVLNARNLLEKNRRFIQEETVAFVDNIWPSKFSYDPDKCSRDTGLIVDALAQDLLFNGTSQSSFAGIQYWNQGLTVIPGEQVTTTNAINYLKDVAAKIITNDTSGYRYYDGGFTYNKIKCARDSGLIVDAIVQDLLFGGTSQSEFSGIQYWNQSGYTGLIAEEITTTTNAISYVKELAEKVVRNATTGTRYTTTASQNVSFPTATDSESNTIIEDFDVILNILSNGTEGVTDIIIPNGIEASLNPNIVKAYNILQANKEYIQEQAVAFVEATKTVGFVYDQSLCYRDVGYMVDSVSFDLLYGGNRQAIQSGVYYYDYNSTSTAIPNEIPQTTAAYDYIKQLVPYIVQGITTTTNQIVVDQIVNLNTGTLAEALILQDNIDIISNIIVNGPDEVITKTPISLTISSTATVVDAGTIVAANREFIVAETIAYIDNKFNSGFVYDYRKCTRDTGLIVDSLAFDLLYGGDSQSTFAGLQYWSQSGYTGSIAQEITTTTNAFNYLKTLVKKVVVNEAVTTSTGNTSVQVLNLTTGTVSAGLTLANNIGTVVDILNNGTVGVSDLIIPNGTATTDSGIVNSYNILLANKTFLEDEVVARIDEIYPSFSYDRTKCRRDVGYIIDSIAFDMLHGGNRQSVMSGVYYYGFNGNETVLVNEMPQATAAYDYIKSIIDDIIQGNQIRDVYQTGVKQEADLAPGTSAESDLVQTNVNLITTIINDGPSAAPTQEPIGLIASTNTNVVNAFNMILANKEFIKAEIISYVEAVFDGTAKQITATTTATASVVNAVNTDFNLIVDILTNGTDGVTDRIIPNSLTASTNTNIINAYNALQANKKYLQKEIVAYVDQTSNFIYDQTKCARDINLIIDAVALDLLYPTTYDSQSTFAGLQYWNQSGYTGSISEELTTTTNAINYLSSIAQKVVINNKTGTRYQNTVTQTTSTLVGTVSEAVAIATDFEVITNILTNGTAGVTDIIVTNGRPSIDENIANAYTLLLANKNYLIAEVIAFVESTKTEEFTYSQTLCARDAGYMIDSIAFDLLHGGNKQAVQSGVYYYNFNATSTAIDNEIPQTTAAYNRIREIIPSLLTGSLITPSAGNTTKQVTYMLPANTAYVTKAQAKIDKITSIINNGPSVVTAKSPISLIASTDPNADRAYDLLIANKEFIRDEVIAYINNKFTGFSYDRAKCFRDVGYMIDSVSFDLLYGGNRQAIQSGVYYFGYDSTSTAIAGEIPQTTSAYNFIEQIVEDIVTGTLITSPQQNTVAQVTNIGSQYYNQTKCERDTGLIVDSFVTDLLFPDNGYTQSIFAGLQYWNQSGYTGSIASELTTTTNAIRFLSSLAQQVVVNNTSTSTVVRYQSTVSQITNLTEASYDQSYRIRDEFGIITRVLTSGTSGITDTIISNGIDPISEDAQYAFDILQANKEYLQAEVIAYVEATKLPAFVYDPELCARDVGYMIDTVSFDILYGGNRQAVQSGVYYYGFSETGSAIPNDSVETIAAYTRLREILPSIIKNEAVTVSPNNTATQVTNLTTATDSEGYRLEDMVDVITGIISNGPNYITDKTPLSLTKSTSSSVLSAVEIINANKDFIVQEIISYINYEFLVGTAEEAQLIKDSVNLINNIIENGPQLVTVKEPISLIASEDRRIVNSAKLLEANRAFIVAETIAYINNTYNTGFLYNKTKCKRDTGLIVDSIAFDLLYDGITESQFSGLQYWNQDTYIDSIPNEITTTTNAVRYIKELVQKVVLNETINITVGNTSTQNVSLDAGNSSVAQSVAGNVDVILGILTGGTAGVTDRIVPNGNESTYQPTLNGYALLQANKSFIQDEVVARINLDNPEFEYDSTLCRRDVGYIINSLCFDLLHGGNRQSITSGVYYYGFNAESTAIKDEIPQTTAAYNYIKEIVGKIVKGETLLKTYQFKVPQVITGDTATDNEVTSLESKIDIITNIINNGPSEAGVKQPISLTASGDSNVINAYKLLLANRAFIQAEVIAYIDSAFTDTPNYPREKCYRDMGAIVDAVGYDLIYGGNYNSVNTGNGYFNRKGQYHLVKLEQNVTDPTLFIDGATVRFYQQSYISASGYLFEYVGAGTQYGALPQVGTADPVQSKEVVQLNNGKVFFTSTDQNGDFRIGPTLVISQSTGVLAGRTFEKSLYATMTPFILVVGS